MKEELGFLDYFAELEDPRPGDNKLYSADELLFLTLLAVVCGAEGWNDIEEFGESKLDFLRSYLPYERGIPSDDTLRRFFRAIDPRRFQECFVSWIESLEIPVDKGVIAIDGKTSRRSFDKHKSPLHLVSAFASEARMVLGQIATEEKSNEITAIPQLLEMLDIRGATISIDAMGCQKNIAKKIKEGGGEYILGLKGNQSRIHDDVKRFFADQELAKKCCHYQDADAGHGRIETRNCFVTDDIDWLKERHDWPGLKSIVKVTSQVEKNGKNTSETRYYLSSCSPNPVKISNAVRSHPPSPFVLRRDRLVYRKLPPLDDRYELRR